MGIKGRRTRDKPWMRMQMHGQGIRSGRREDRGIGRCIVKGIQARVHLLAQAAAKRDKAHAGLR